MIRSMQFELSRMTDQQLDDLRIDLLRQVHQQKLTHQDLGDEDDARHELRSSSPPRFMGLDENQQGGSARRLHDARDQR